jgi:acyl carrier protein
MSSVNNYDAKAFLADIFEVPIDNIPEDASLDTYDRWDSLGHMRIILHLEEIVGSTLNTEDMLNIIDLTNIQKLLNTRK